MSKIKIALIVLIVTAVMLTSVSAYCYVKVNEKPEAPNWAIKASIVENPEYPQLYSNLTDLDPWTLEAIENLGQYVYTYSWKCKARSHFCYEGKYYNVEITWLEPLDNPGTYISPIPANDTNTNENYQKFLDYSPIGFSALATSGAVLGVMWLKIKKKP